MSKRNFILLIIILVLVIAGVFIFLLTRQPKTPAGGDIGGTNFGSIFSPFGNNNKPTPPKTIPPPVDVSGYQPPAPVATAKLLKVSSMPVAGFTVYSKERLIDVPVVAPVIPPIENPVSGTTTLPIVPPTKKTTLVKPTPPLTEFVPALRYVDRATGNIYETFADKIAERKFSTTIIPQVYEAYFGNNGETVVMRYLKADGKTIETFVGNLPKEILGGDTTADNEVKGAFLPGDVKDISVSSDKGSIFYLFNSTNSGEDNMIGTILNLTTNKKTQIFSSPFNEWLSLFPNKKIATLTTKPASGIPGYMYGIDPTNSKSFLTQVLGNINGLTTLTSPDGKKVLYGNDNLSLSIYHTDTKVSDPFGVRTVPEKCVWGKGSDVVYCSVPKSIEGAQYPDAWYQGEVSFSDQVWKIDVASGNTTMIADPITISGGKDVDGIKLALDDGENYLFFVNKKDSFLWELNLK